jgi:hypothetical protein
MNSKYLNDFDRIWYTPIEYKNKYKICVSLPFGMKLVINIFKQLLSVIVKLEPTSTEPLPAYAILPVIV